jgi:hypothetical protein
MTSTDPLNQSVKESVDHGSSWSMCLNQKLTNYQYQKETQNNFEKYPIGWIFDLLDIYIQLQFLNKKKKSLTKDSSWFFEHDIEENS